MQKKAVLTILFSLCICIRAFAYPNNSCINCEKTFDKMRYYMKKFIEVEIDSVEYYTTKMEKIMQGNKFSGCFRDYPLLLEKDSIFTNKIKKIKALKNYQLTNRLMYLEQKMLLSALTSQEGVRNTLVNMRGGCGLNGLMGYLMTLPKRQRKKIYWDFWFRGCEVEMSESDEKCWSYADCYTELKEYKYLNELKRFNKHEWHRVKSKEKK